MLSIIETYYLLNNLMLIFLVSLGMGFLWRLVYDYLKRCF